MTTDTIGSAATHGGGWNGMIFAAKVIASASGKLQTIGQNFAAASGNGRLALYSHNAGSDKPASLLAEVGSYGVSVGWNDKTPGSTPDIVQGTAYWIAMQVTAGDCYQTTGGGIRRSYKSYTFGAFPATWPADSTENNGNICNERITYAPPAPPTVTTQAATGIGLD